MALKNNRVNINDGGNRTRVDQHYTTAPTRSKATSTNNGSSRAKDSFSGRSGKIDVDKRAKVKAAASSLAKGLASTALGVSPSGISAVRKTQARKVASNPASGMAMNATKIARPIATKQAYNTATKKAVNPDEMRSAYSAFRKQAKKR